MTHEIRDRVPSTPYAYVIMISFFADFMQSSGVENNSKCVVICISLSAMHLTILGRLEN